MRARPIHLTGIALIAAAGATGLAGQPARIAVAAPAIDAAAIMSHVKVLSSDEFQGRAPGTKGEELTVANAQKYTTLHPRCGTSFLLIVMVLGILVFSFVPKDAPFYIKALSRLVFIPLIAGLSYEVIKFSSKRMKNPLMAALVAPGLWLQKLTTKEPSDDQLEVALRLAPPEKVIPYRRGLEEHFAVANCLAAIGACVVGLGLDPEQARRGIAALRGIPGRMERINLGQDFLAIVDFAHTPNALKVALEAARKMTPGRVIAVFGSAGLRDRAKRRMMAEVSVGLADITILTAEDPRTEELDAILAEMAAAAAGKGGIEGTTFLRIPDRGAAIQQAVELAGPEDLVISCGKGHEQSMCFGTVEYPWDDRTAMRAALGRRLGVPGYEMPKLPTSSR